MSDRARIVEALRQKGVYVHPEAPLSVLEDHVRVHGVVLKEEAPVKEVAEEAKASVEKVVEKPVRKPRRKASKKK